MGFEFQSTLENLNISRAVLKFWQPVVLSKMFGTCMVLPMPGRSLLPLTSPIIYTSPLVGTLHSILGKHLDSFSGEPGRGAEAVVGGKMGGKIGGVGEEAARRQAAATAWSWSWSYSTYLSLHLFPPPLMFYSNLRQGFLFSHVKWEGGGGWISSWSKYSKHLKNIFYIKII